MKGYFRKTKNDALLKENHVIIFIPKKEILFEALVDLTDYERIEKLGRKLFINPQGYAVFNSKIDNVWQSVLLHRFILNFPEEIVDHINFNKLDNRKSNLRVVTKSQNCSHQEHINPLNKSGYKFISYDSFGDRWRVSVIRNKKRYITGHKSLDEAKERVKYLERTGII